MLPRNQRLRTAEVAHVIKTGTSVRGRFLSAKITRTAREGNATIRAAGVVSKTLAKSAPARNRLRRAMYAALESIAPPTNLNVVLFLRSIPPEPLVSALRTDVEDLLLRFRA